VSVSLRILRAPRRICCTVFSHNGFDRRASKLATNARPPCAHITGARHRLPLGETSVHIPRRSLLRFASGPHFNQPFLAQIPFTDIERQPCSKHVVEGSIHTGRREMPLVRRWHRNMGLWVVAGFPHEQLPWKRGSLAKHLEPFTISTGTLQAHWAAASALTAEEKVSL